MIEVRKILCPTDFSPCSDEALAGALWLARRFGAELHILHAAVLFEGDRTRISVPMGSAMDTGRQLVAIAGEKLRALAGSHDDIGVRLVTSVRRGISPEETILAYAGENDIDLVVMGTHGRGGITHLFLGSTAEHVVQKARCPVLTLRQVSEPGSAGPVRRILVPVDFSDRSRVALANAREIASALGARLDLLHVVEDPPPASFYEPGATPAFVHRPRPVDSSLERLRSFHEKVPGPDVEAGFHERRGRPARRIAAFAADHETDLIVIGTHGLTGVEHLLLGSVAEKVVRRAPCPVLTVKAFGRIPGTVARKEARRAAER
jgi:nucleotide-binding universal stress UspA family protein